jgi:hydroxymethylbilane synthase
MKNEAIRIGTRESQLAVWQATQVKDLLAAHGYSAELVFIRSEGDIDLQTPLYEIGVQGIFTKTLDAALINGRIDMAVHSMKDVPTGLAKGIVPAAVLSRASYKDILVPKGSLSFLDNQQSAAVIATSSIRRRAQWLHRYPQHRIENLRGNVNTRLKKVAESDWNGAIFAAAGLERINLRPEAAVELDWMLPAPAQGAIMVVCREGDEAVLAACQHFHDADTALCTAIERDFLRTLQGGCTAPISALAEIKDGEVSLDANVLSVDGTQKISITKMADRSAAAGMGVQAGMEVLENGGREILEAIRNGGK